MQLAVLWRISVHPGISWSLNWMDSLRSQHLEQREYDVERTTQLEEMGYKVLRFWNNDVVNDIEGVIRVILDALEQDGLE